ncbi:MAG: RNA-binding transcriptional accessory protein, partial [Oscillospiraceae bacterium]|nr:RNA-binding transcriptional accessory protein [Oscillospiraceae bacterium]
MENIEKLLAAELGAKEEYIINVVKLLDEGNTIPFIARYRKELHGAMDDTALRTLEERLNYLRNLQKRRDEVKHSIEEQGKLTDELSAAIDSAKTLAEVEDLYRPYKQKRRTRATVAREKGLGPLAEEIFRQEKDMPELSELAAAYIDPEKGVETLEDALAGASDIIAEMVSDSAEARKLLRETVTRKGTLNSKANTEEDTVYRLYYDFSQPVYKMQGHQVLAINRGENEEKLKVSVSVMDTDAMPPLVRMFVTPGRKASEFVRAAVEDSYSRLLFPSIEREIRTMLTDEASEGAIKN